MVEYAQLFHTYHAIVFTTQNDGHPSEKQVGNLTIRGTNTKYKITSLIRAVIIGRQLCRESSHANCVVSSQDPFETSLVAFLISIASPVKLHIQIHGDVLNTNFIKEKLSNRIRVLWATYILKRADKIRVVSRRIKDSLLQRGIRVTKIQLLPIASDISQFITKGQTRTYTSPAPLKLLYVGRFAPEKNLSLLLHALHQVMVSHDDVQLTLLGEGPEQNHIQNLINQLQLENKVNVLPWSDSVSQVMMDHDILCVSSLHEGWGMVMVEASATGLPVITTDVGCAGEFIVDQTNGTIVKDVSVDAYAEAIKRYLTHPQLVAEQGKKGHILATHFNTAHSQYLQKIVESYTISDN
jgi:glycosyltransferase involved in cell wall biosynthesis